MAGGPRPGPPPRRGRTAACSAAGAHCGSAGRGTRERRRSRRSRCGVARPPGVDQPSTPPRCRIPRLPVHAPRRSIATTSPYGSTRFRPGSRSSALSAPSSAHAIRRPSLPAIHGDRLRIPARRIVVEQQQPGLGGRAGGGVPGHRQVEPPAGRHIASPSEYFVEPTVQVWSRIRSVIRRGRSNCRSRGRRSRRRAGAQAQGFQRRWTAPGWTRRSRERAEPAYAAPDARLSTQTTLWPERPDPTLSCW